MYILTVLFSTTSSSFLFVSELYNFISLLLCFCLYSRKNIDELERIITNNPGFIKAMWCGDVECENKVKEIRGTKSRCILEGHEHIDDKCIVCGKPAKELVVWGIQY